MFKGKNKKEGYRHLAAFDCANCPENSDYKKGPSCPLWWKTIQTNPATGEEKILESCGYEQLPIYLMEVIKASNRPAHAVESMRNFMITGLEKVAAAVSIVPDIARRQAQLGIDNANDMNALDSPSNTSLKLIEKSNDES